mmetsp:Transcript_30239/g.63172  ORF Transcript_30239/g.63172 Transcript_30239/m.63172 type:complete len:338 (-) Transcript_30239:24-1037(-)
MKIVSGYLCFCGVVLLCCMLEATTAMSSRNPPQKVAVIGATGRLGRIAVQQLVDQGIGCNLLMRSKPTVELEEIPTALTGDSTKEEVVAYLASLEGVNIVQGDVGNVQALEELFADCQACLALYGSTRRSVISDIWNKEIENDPTHAKQINYQGVANILTAAKASSSCRRIVRITGKGEEPTSFFSVVINMLGSMAKAWNYEGERILRGQKDIEYTIVRPGLMGEEGPEGKVLQLADDGGDLKVAKIRYADIASLCIESLKYENAGRSTLTAMTVEEGNGADSWAPLLETVQHDRREFPSDMLEQHKAAVKSAVIKLGAVTGVLFAVLVQFVVGLFS